ncbi:MAG: putative manganese-dependent inorganic diphosphatase [Anaerovoracaceae bacterium]|mgnify:FL=1|uniref:inorganic diphosphatase n=1 Tax=Candidatus Fimisoma avicola TaxID=2840826 RepID=A0A9D1I688_9FIRM|nr:putative manganese-dependent inorganic diphosphatase [Candidatus Fimisoma avicola]
MDQNSKVYVIGHKNPDTDSICSAIAYAELKRRITGKFYEARRAGQINEETKYILDRFGVEPPEFLDNVSLQVKDMDINRMKGIDGNVSIKDVWEMMKARNMKTMPIVSGDSLEGLITIGDIATSYMDVHDSKILAKAQTPYENIKKALDGSMVSSASSAQYTDGKVAIAASGTDIMEDFIEKGDLVILGNRYEAQLCAIELEAACMVICQGTKVPDLIKRLAEEKGIAIISTPHDAFTAARLINQSIPVRYFMSRENLTTFDADELVDDIRETMAKKRYRDFPVLDEKGRFIGFISRRRLLGARKKKVILVDHNERSQSIDGISDAEILEIIDHHRIGSVETVEPVFFRNQPVGSTSTIVAQMYKENDVEISKTMAALMCSAIISDTLLFRSPTCTPADRRTCEELAGIAGINMEELARSMFNAGSDLSGKTAEEICAMDFKQFVCGDMTFGVGQISSMDREELDEIKGKLEPAMNELMKEKELNMLFFMLTDVMEESSDILWAGPGARELIAEAFGAGDGENFRLDGVVSRKKQMVPAIMGALRR